MNGLIHFTERDLTVLRALSFQVRLFGQRQLAESLWHGDVANTRRRMRRFVDLGLIERQVTLARPLPELLGPVAQWRPGQSEPDVSRIAFQLQSRWRYRAMRSTVVFTPTKTVVNHFGGRQKATLSPQVSHDLGVSAVWLWFCCFQPDLAQAWRSEDMLTDIERNQSVPDAVLVDQDEHPLVLIEYGGDYSADRVAAFHDDAASRGLPYQIW
mgnify:CR=1 FL=1|tara:strand:- start:40512 stop:41147 length:636 start_codon:yes stop_codon:yes gene_type:complete